MSLEEQFAIALETLNLELIDQLLLQGVRATWTHASNGGNFLHILCNPNENPSHSPELITRQALTARRLMEMKGLGVDFQDASGWTPFARACEAGNEMMIQLFLREARVDVNQPNHNGAVPAWYLSYYGGKQHVLGWKWLLASGRRIDVERQKATNVGSGLNCIQIAAKKKDDCWTDEERRPLDEILALLEEYQQDPVRLRNRLRKELGVQSWFPFDISFCV